MCLKCCKNEASTFVADSAMVLQFILLFVACFLAICCYHVELSSVRWAQCLDMLFFLRVVLYRIAEYGIGRRHNVYGACHGFLLYIKCKCIDEVCLKNIVLNLLMLIWLIIVYAITTRTRAKQELLAVALPL